MYNNERELKRSFQRGCKRVFEWVYYKPHTIYHANRFPLIGTWDSWKRLNDRFTCILKGKIPEATTDDEAQHVLDIILYQNQKLSSLNFVETDMFTIVIVDALLPMSADDIQTWTASLKNINGSIFILDYDTSTEKQASGYQATTNDNRRVERPTKVAVCNHVYPRFSVVHLITDKNIRPGEVDVLSVIFNDIQDVLSDYQEEEIRNIMQQCGALIYNEDLKRNDPPDGYYLCNSICLNTLKHYFRDVPHTFATIDVFNTEISSNKYILLTVEVKLSIDSLQCKLSIENYYILEPAPHPIRNLVIVNGGQVTRIWLFLINLAHVDKTNRQTRIDERIFARSREFAQRLRYSHTHIVYEASFSSETFREVPLTAHRLGILCKLIELEQKIDHYSKPIAGISGWEKRALEHVHNEKKRSYFKEMICIINNAMRNNFLYNPRWSINVSILKHEQSHSERLFSFLEQLAMSLLNEMQETVSNANQNIRIPKILEKHAKNLRSVKPAPPVRIPAPIQPAPLPTENNDDDDEQIGEQPS